MKQQDCRRAGARRHNAAFDLGFLNAGGGAPEIKRNRSIPFSCFDTATLAGAAFGQTVLAKAAQVCGSDWIRAKRIRRSTTPNARPTSSAKCAMRSTAVAQGRDARAGVVERRAV
jgi:ribonuclease T